MLDFSTVDFTMDGTVCYYVELTYCIIHIRAFHVI